MKTWLKSILHLIGEVNSKNQYDPVSHLANVTLAPETRIRNYIMPCSEQHRIWILSGPIVYFNWKTKEFPRDC